MGFCSESLLLFAAFHPEKSANDCLGDLQWFGWRPWDLPRRHFMDFFWGGSTIGVNFGGMKRKNWDSHPEIHCYYFYGLVTSPKVVIASEQISKIVDFNPFLSFLVDFHPLEDDAKKPTTCGLVKMVDSMFAEMRWVPFFDRKYRRPCDSYRMGQMDTDGGIEVSTLGKC